MDMSLLGIIVALVVLIIICYRKFNPVVGNINMCCNFSNIQWFVCVGYNYRYIFYRIF